MYYSVIGLLAILVLLIVNWDVLRDSQVYSKHLWKVYRYFLFSVLAYYVTDVLWGVFEGLKLPSALFADTTIYFIAMSVGVALWAEFTVVFLNDKSSFGTFIKYVCRATAGVIAFITIINNFYPVLFTVDSNSVYTPLSARYVMLSVQIVLLLIISIRAITLMYRTKNPKQYRMLAAFGINMGVFLIIQFWFPYLPLYSIGYMLGTCFIHSFVVNSEKEGYKRDLEESDKIKILKERFSSLLNNLPGLAFTKDAETGVYLACNQTFAEYACKDKPEDVIGLTDEQIFDSQTAAHLVADDKIALSLSKPYIFYEETPDPDGNLRRLQTTKIKYTDTQGRLCVLGMGLDVTALVNIKRENDITKEAYEKAVDAGHMYNHIANTLARDYNRLFYVNTDTEEFTEYRRKDDGKIEEARTGWHFFSDCKMELAESVCSEDKEDFLDAINRKNLMKSLNNKDTFIMTYREMVQDRPVYVSMKVSRMLDDDQYIIIGFLDVDDETRDVIFRNELMSDDLASEQNNGADYKFLTGMSREIRTPINTIIGLDNLALRDTNLDDSSRDYFIKIGDSSKQLLALVNDILNYSMIESGRRYLNSVEFSFETMMEQINALIMHQCADKGVLYECNVINQLDEYYIGDDVKLREVLINILTNAVNFTDESGHVTVTVEKLSEYKDLDTIRFCIKDTGIGMDEESMSKLFDPHTIDEQAFKSYNGSSGLGMTITKKIIDMMNGIISVESEKGIGTEFTVIIPLRKSLRAYEGDVGKIDVQALYILIVDNSPIESEYARMVFENLGIRADVCTSGKDALLKMEIQHARKQPYNIVLMDWDIQDMNNIEFSSEITRLYGDESIVVVLSACNWEDIRDDALQAGVQNYIEKPLNKADIIANLEQIARRSKMSIFKEKNKARLVGRRVLMAEDMDINADIVINMLEMENIRVDHAKNGIEAVDMFENSTEGIYSAVLMDVRMDKMDGLEATKVIRSMDRADAKRIPIIALTDYSFDEDVQRSLQVGMNAHLKKPVEAETLIRVLGELIYESEQKM